MTLSIVYVLLLLGHILGDFYFQSHSVAKRKDKEYKILFLHSGIYMICMAGVLSLGISFSCNLVWLWLFVSAAHFWIDFFKRYIKSKPFIFDQLLHLLTLSVAWLIWGRYLQAKNYIFFEVAYFPSRPIVVIILGLLCILTPVGLLIEKGEIWDFAKNKNVPNESQKSAGKMIGYLERIIVFFLLLIGQYTAIAFIIAVKSMARSLEKGNDKDEDSPSEYYLIGTLLSMTSVFSITLLLGLAKIIM